MAILNVTPDSYFSESRFFNPDDAIARGVEMEKEGADILDIGGESTRPFSEPVPLEEEINRVIPVIASLKSKISIPISIDTMKFEVAKKALDAGASLINDVTGFQDIKMVELAVSYKTDICVMHMQGNPKTMQINPTYNTGIINELMHYFEERIQFLTKKGVQKEHIILDPGIGFGKSIADNLKIIQNLLKLKTLGFPLLLGISRKSFMGKITNQPPTKLLPATLGLNTMAILSNVDFIRVHDLSEHRMLIDVMQKYLENE